MRSILDEVTKRRRRGWSGSQHSDSTNQSDVGHLSTQDDELDDEDELAKLYQLPSEAEVLQRARETHSNVDFESLAAGPEKGGPWRRVEGADRFVVFKRVPSSNIGDSRVPGLEVMCAGHLNASLEEVASVLRSRSEVDHANTMEGLHKKNFIFGSLDREVPCLAALVEEPQNQEEDGAVDTSEQLTVKTASFVRSTLLGRNEQWCFSEFFQRKKERDGFTISQCALPPLEPTPGRVVGANARVDQLHGLNASCLVDKLANRKGLRVVYNAWFEDALKNIECSTVSTESMSSRNDSRRRSSGLSVSSLSSSSSSSSRKSSVSSGFISLSSRAASRRRSSGQSVNSNASLASLDEHMEDKAQLRRLLSLAHGMTKLPGLIRRRRFGVQVPADHDTIQIQNTRCPCCTHSLAPVKMSLSMAASALSKRSLRSLKTDTRRCYLCGYRVCIDCWSAEYMESSVGRVAAIVVCTRCHACVKACDYSEVYAPGQEHTRGPPKVVEDPPNDSPASLLTDFLAASLMNTSATSADRAAVHSVVRMLLRQSESGTDSESDSDSDDSFDWEENSNKIALDELDQFLRDENQLLDLESCTFANSQRRGYVLDLPDEPETAVPPTVIPSHEDARLALANEKGLLQLAYQLAPPDPPAGSVGSISDVQDLDLLCELAVRASGYPNTFVSIMGTKHLHILSSSNPAFRHATMPREHTVCQHTILTPKAFMIPHPEADVRFHELGAIKGLSTRCYMAFPLLVPMSEDDDKTLGGEMPMGTLCCVTPEARSELTRSQYTTLKRLADTASRLILTKGRQLQQQRRAQSIDTRGSAPVGQPSL